MNLRFVIPIVAVFLLGAGCSENGTSVPVLTTDVQVKTDTTVVAAPQTILSADTAVQLKTQYKSGDCIEAKDGYVWHINSYDSGNYFLMGWQGAAWGNEVKMEKSVVERNDIDGLPVYHKIICPEVGL